MDGMMFRIESWMMRNLGVKSDKCIKRACTNLYNFDHVTLHSLRVYFPTVELLYI